MDELEREDMRRDVEIDAMYKKYEVEVTVTFKMPLTATNAEEAKSEAYDDIRRALKGSELDYDFGEFEAEEIDDGRTY